MTNRSTARGLVALAASALAAIAAVIASLGAEPDIVPFFVVLTFAGGVAAWCAQPPFDGVRRWIARLIATAWLIAAVWVGALLVMYVTVWQGSSTGPPVPADTYLGLPETVYHLVGLYGGAVLVLLAAFGREHWFGAAA